MREKREEKKKKKKQENKISKRDANRLACDKLFVLRLFQLMGRGTSQFVVWSTKPRAKKDASGSVAMVLTGVGSSYALKAATSPDEPRKDCKATRYEMQTWPKTWRRDEFVGILLLCR